MSVLVRFAPASMTAEKYDQASAKVQAETEWPPDGLQLHVCFGSGNQMRVSEIWESREKQQAFAERLMPILSDAGIQFTTEPEFLEVHAMELGSSMSEMV
jgi:hypothetical protein